jgi:3-demethoxyubiquinol 3-hydroxylase
MPTGTPYNEYMSSISSPSTPAAPILSNKNGDWSPTDRLISGLDQALRTILGVHQSHRPNPAGSLTDTVTNPADRNHVAGLMRINHAGEVAAQALYAGQALTAKGAATQASMIEAAQEETDHLAWCAERIEELGGRKSILNPLWYAGSFAIGALAGLAGDKVSLGFVAETEKQVGDHLDSHLRDLPHGDARTRAIIEQMRIDEARHGQNATKAGANELPPPIRTLMKLTSKVMTHTAYRL